MSFAFCWEFLDCARECQVRDTRTLFCWRARVDERGVQRNECDTCSYRQAWVRGELSIADFAQLHERRGQPRTARRVLVVDDEPNILYALEETVRDLGFECIAAGDGEDALIIARGTLPDLIITDVMMPRLNGYELCERLKAEAATREIPVVIITVRAGERDRTQGSSAGADAYLTKPFHFTELRKTIDDLLPPRTS